MLTRNLDGVPKCDVYCFIAPCTAFSPAGKNKGIEDPNGALVFAAIMYIQEKRPVAVLSENVASCAQKHKASMQLLVDTIRGLGYEATRRITSTYVFGIPQIRKRWYMQAVRNDALRSNDGGVPHRLEPFGVCIPLKRLITPVARRGCRRRASSRCSAW